MAEIITEWQWREFTAVSLASTFCCAILATCSFSTSIFALYHLSNDDSHHVESQAADSFSSSRTTISRLSAKISSKFNLFRQNDHNNVSSKDLHQNNRHGISKQIQYLTRLSIISYQLFTGVIIASIFFLQLGYQVASIYIIAVSFAFTAIGKHSMYALFAYRLRNTFRGTPTFRVSKRVLILIFLTVIINCIAYLSQVYWYVEFRLHNDYTLWFVGLGSIPIEMISSFLILANFATRLLKVKFQIELGNVLIC